MLVRRLVLLLVSAVLFASCSPADSTAVLPTVASIPTSIPTSTPIEQTSTPVATFTLIPPISTLDFELTRAFSDSAANATREYTSQIGLLNLKQYGTLTPDEKALAHFSAVEVIGGGAKILVASDIITREMRIGQAGVKGQAGIGPFYHGAFYISYLYTSDTLSPLNYLNRVPATLCALREAGFTYISGQIKIVLQSAKSKRQIATTNRCINSQAVNQLNCEDPSRTNVDALLSDTGCDLTG